MSHRSPGRSLGLPAPQPLLLLLLLQLPWAAAAAQFYSSKGVIYATVYWQPDTRTVEVRNVLDKTGDAYGFFNDSIGTTGWGILEIRSGYNSRDLSNEIIMFLAGYLEGYLTAPLMYDHFLNLYPQLIKDPAITDKVYNFLLRQDMWTREKIRLQKADPFWRHTGYVMAQMDGLYIGAIKRASVEKTTSLTMAQVQFLNAVGDLLDIIPSLSPTKESSMKVFKRWDMGHCSALIKVLPGFENIYFAHSSWYTYAAMLRIYKHWDFNIRDKDTTSSRLSFSSYPGFLESLDDFYILSSGLVLLQTTNNVYNRTLLKLVVPETLLAWQRVRVANMMAEGGKDWAEIFSKYNSGTYNNQYMVLDLKKVNLKKSLDKGTLYVVEQIPTYVQYSEQTKVLRKGYWPSYNIPFHEKVYNLSGYPMLVQRLGLDYSYDLTPRAKIFRRDQGTVTDLASMKYIMRYNNYKVDPYSAGDPCNTICCREDLNDASPIPGGCYDTKVADVFLASRFTAYAISGPTVQDGLPVFNWSRFNRTLHRGMPEVFNFDFVTMSPVLTQDKK
ncbi:phospholipase B-like 1 [Cricetulus griseus]|uniref:Phospholipase B-like n=2 Tax=Cricetulus griseus TaxID=10029 RepID=A0A9J7K0Q0_CRIGR|nr:phospholipase B-like 1 [Cricetulus griseus]XP_027285708.1 phospholipase B-like 1 [Cricetulus griseus]ERE66605.1 phospholipase B-like 1-like protein [Cricetulus griseus]